MGNLKKQLSLLIFILIIPSAFANLNVTNMNYTSNSWTLQANATSTLKFTFTGSKLFERCSNMSTIISPPKYSIFSGLCRSKNPFFECSIQNNSITIRSINCESYQPSDGRSIQLFIDYLPYKRERYIAFVAYSTISSSQYEQSNVLAIQNFITCDNYSLQPQCQQSYTCESNYFRSKNTRFSVCFPCSPLCIQCSDYSQCLTCSAGYDLSTDSTCDKKIECSIKQFRVTSTRCQLCAQSCRTCDQVAYNCTSCYRQYQLAVNYTADTYKINQLCVQIKSSESSIITFLPFSMSFAALTFATLFSKFINKQTMFRNIACALSGSIESMSWIFYTSYIVLNLQMDKIILNPTIYLFIGAIITNTIFNFISVYLFLRYIFGDKTFKNQLVSIHQKYSLFPYYFVIASSIFLSHKIIQLLFSKMFTIASLSFRISSLDKLVPVTYIRYFSLIPSIIAITAAILGKISFENLENMFSLLTWDLIALTSISLISTIWVAQRSLEDYETKINNENADPNQNIMDQIYIMKTSKRGSQGEVRFSDIKREYLDEPSRRRSRLQKQTTEGNLFLSSEANSQECYYNQIHVNAFEKDEINSLRDTRLTQLNIEKRQSQQGKSSQRSDSADLQEFNSTPYRSTRRIKGLYNRRRNSRSSKSLYSQEDNTILSQNIEANLSYQEIHKLKILQNIQQIWQQIPESVKIDINSLYTNSYRMTRSQIISSISKLTNDELKKMDEHTQISIRQVQFSLSLLDQVNITINQFLDYLSNLNRLVNKENNANINNMETSQHRKNSSKSHRYRANSIEAKQNKSKRRYPPANSYSHSSNEVQSQGNEDEQISQFALENKFSQTHLRRHARNNISKSIKSGYRSPSRSNQPQPISQVDKQLETDKKAVGPVLSIEKKKSNITQSMDGINRNLAQRFESKVTKSSEQVRADVKKAMKTKVAQSIIIHEDNYNEIIELEEDQFANGVSVADVIQRYTNTQHDLIQNVPDENQKSYVIPPRRPHKRRERGRYAN